MDQLFFEKETWDLIVSFLTTLAIIIGGYWSYRLYRLKREHKPQLKIGHKINLVPFDEHHSLLKLFVRVENIGNVFIKGFKGKFVITNINPPPEDSDLKKEFKKGTEIIDPKTNEIEWPDLFRKHFNLERHYLEPNEVDEHVFDLVVPKSVSFIQIYSHIKNDSFIKWPWFWYFKNWKINYKDLGWNKTSNHTLSHNGK